MAREASSKRSAPRSGHQDIWTRLWLTLTKGDPVNPKAIGVSGATIILALVVRGAGARLLGCRNWIC